jgi:hypothetical protein
MNTVETLMVVYDNCGLRSKQPMYKIICESCGEYGFHPSRVAAETQAETHTHETGHASHIEPMTEALSS